MPYLVLPLNGQGKRFKDEEYKTEKQLLKLGDETCLRKSINSIRNLKNFEVIAFLDNKNVEDELRDIQEDLQFDLTITKIAPTSSSVATLLNGLKVTKGIKRDEHLTVFTLDLELDPAIDIEVSKNENFTYTFKANSELYSYVKLDDRNFVTEIADKKPITNLANIGIYGFSSINEFMNNAKALLKEKMINEPSLIEVFQLGIPDNPLLSYHYEGSVLIYGTPLEYEFLKQYYYRIKNTKKAIVLSDHSGLKTTEKIKQYLKMTDMQIIEVDPSLPINNYANLCHKILRTNNDSDDALIFASCKSGQGFNITLNKLGRISCLIYDEESFELAILHNNANAFVFPDSIFSTRNFEWINKFRNLTFEGGRHIERLKIACLKN